MVKAGDIYGRLTLIRSVEPTSYARHGSRKYGLARWECLCECGKIKHINQSDIVTGKTKSCGCLNLETVVKKNHKHGHSGSKLHKIWANMRSRCRDSNRPDYHRYGGRGIAVCEEWDDYKVFASWATKAGYRDGLEIDRIDNDGNYCPANCRWVTHAENMRNTSRTVLDENDVFRIRGMSRQGYSVPEIAEQFGVSNSAIQHILRNRNWAKK